VTRQADIGELLREAFALHRQGRLREADKLYARVLKLVPDNFDALHLSGLAKAQAGQMGEAYRLIAAALKVNNRAADAYVNFANVLHALKRDGEALEALDRALALRPGDADIMRLRGNALLSLDRAEEALVCFEVSLAANPRQAEALANRGAALAALQRPEEALRDFDTALALAPHHAGALYNRGNALLELGRAAPALEAFDRALERAPNHAQAWNNRGRALQVLNRHREAVESFGKALALEPNYADAHSNRALSLLTLGDLARGFAEYEWRWKRSGMSDIRRSYRGRLWLGEYPLARKTVLLTAEQGLGDTIQFSRYAPLLARAGARVLLEVQAELKALMSTLAGVAAVCARGEQLPPYDVYCPLGSLPLAMGTEPTTIPADIPYLAAEEVRLARWRPVLAALPGRRVAFAWAGHAKHPNDRNRSIDLALWSALLKRSDISCIGIQRDLRAEDGAQLAGLGNVTHLGDRLDDMADTAAVIALADLTIAVDTSVAHLAGALGRPVWVLLPFSPDWRWTLSERSPWYPQARLFRQPAAGDWPSVMSAVGAALDEFVAG
jgi:tetratricopeptide (TPR) repeat protein